MNVLLCIAKIYAAVTSGSLAVLASAIDSVLDLLSGSIVSKRREKEAERREGKERGEDVSREKRRREKRGI